MPFYLDHAGILKLEEFDRWPWLIHGFSGRSAGNLAPERNRKRFLESLGSRGMQLATLRQIHSSIVRVVGNGLEPGQRGDSLIASKPGVLVGVKIADCLPVLVVDPKLRVVAAIHAGWRGILKRVVEKTVGEMRRHFGCAPSKLLAVIGPGIQACCFEVGPEVLAEFTSQFVDADRFCRADPPNPAQTMIPRQVMTGNHALMRPLDSDRGCVDLAEAAHRQLLAAGLAQERIYDSGLCTACNLNRFYSYRREKDAAGRMMAVIGVRAER